MESTTRLDLSHLRREARTALELAIVELAPNDLIDRLALVTGLSNHSPSFLRTARRRSRSVPRPPIERESR